MEIYEVKIVERVVTYITVKAANEAEATKLGLGIVYEGLIAREEYELYDTKTYIHSNPNMDYVYEKKDLNNI